MWKPPRKLLPVHFPPEPDELFSSWLVRLATAHHIKLHNFSRHIFGNRRIWNRDIDKSADAAHIEKVIEYTGKGFEKIRDSTLWTYEGTLYEKHNPIGNQRWLLPTGIYRQKRKRFGLQICPLCLSEDREPYYRIHWRLSITTVCLKHQINLLDRCPGCNNPIMFHRGDMGWRNQSVSFSMVICSICDTAWTSRTVIDSLGRAEPNIICFQQRIEDALRDRWIYLKNCGYVHSINFFNGLGQILRVLSICRRTPEFRNEVAVQSGVSLDEISKELESERSFELLSVESRRRILTMAMWLIDDWSNRFINTAIDTGTYISAFLPYNEPLPYWYWFPLRKHLSKSGHIANEQEIFAAVNYVLVRDGFVMTKNLKKLIGRDFLKGKSDGFKISLYGKMIKANKEGERKRLAQVQVKAKEVKNDLKSVSKTMALKNSREFLRRALKPPTQLQRTQTLLGIQLTRAKRRERLKMAQQMEKEQNAKQVARKFGVSPQIITKWYQRYQEGGIANLDDRPRSPQNFPHKKVYSKQEKWIRLLHAEGIELKEMRDELESRYEFEMSEGGLYAVLQRLELSLPCSSKNKFHYRNRRKAASRQSFPQRKIYEQQRQWILKLHGEGLSTPKIKKELKKRYDFEIGLDAIQQTLKHIK